MDYGIPHGGLNPKNGFSPVRLDEVTVAVIHERGGTILGRQNTEIMLAMLVWMYIDLLFCIGGDGTLRAAYKLAQEILRRDLGIGEIGMFLKDRIRNYFR